MKFPRVSGDDWKYIVRLILTGLDNNLTVADNFTDGKLKLTVPGNYADDVAAAAGGVAVGEIYRNGSVLQIRVS